MIFSSRFLIELPFIINLPNGPYEFRYEDNLIRLFLNNDYFALTTYGSMITHTFAIGPLENLKKHQETLDASLIKLRTVVMFESIASTDALIISDEKDLISAAKSILYKSDPYPTDEEAKDYLNNLSRAELEEVKYKTEVKKTAEKLLPISLAEKCIDLVNKFIRHYAVTFQDQFVEEISLYQAAEGATNGVLQQHFFEGSFIQSAPLVGLIPPLMRNTWHTPTEEIIDNFKKKILMRDFEQSSELLLLRAKNLQHKGAYRSSIIEASAAFENFIAINLKNKMLKAGMSLEHIESVLRENWRFDIRCKKLFKKNFGKSIPEISPLLWQKVERDRDELRNKIAHSSHEPKHKEAEQVIVNVDELIENVKKFLLQVN